MKTWVCLITLLFGAQLLSASEIKLLTLDDCEQAALAFSPQIKRLGAEASAAQSVYKAAHSTLYPSFYIDGKGGWVSEVPTLQLGGQPMKFGDEWNYSVGPTLEYRLFDYGARTDTAKSAQAAYQAKLQELAFEKKQLLLQVRQAYFAVQRDLESMYFMSQQLKVSRKQLTDVRAALDAGAKSRLDVLMAEKRALRAQVDVSNARSATAGHLRDLFKLTGRDFGIDAAYPLDYRVQEQLEGRASSIVKADSPAETLLSLRGFSSLNFDAQGPKFLALEQLIQYYEYASSSYESALWPQINVTAGAYWEYPNGPIREHVFLGKAGASVRVPLFEGSRNRQQARAQKHSAEAARYQKEEVEEDLKALFYCAKERLSALDIEDGLTTRLIGSARQSAQLTYQAYQAGAVTFLEVDNANLALLESQIALTNLHLQRLNSLAVMDSLGKEGTL